MASATDALYCLQAIILTQTVPS